MHVRVDAGDAAGLLHIMGDPVELGAPPRVVAEDLGAGPHDRAGLHQRHAGVPRVDLGQFVGVLVDQVGDAAEYLGPFRSRLLLPDTGFEAGAGAYDGFIDRSDTPVGELADLFLADRVDDRDHLAGTRPLTEFVEDSLKRHV